MRIVHVTNTAERSSLGIERVATYLAIAQKARGCDVMIAADRRGIFTDECGEHEIPVIVNSDLGAGGMPTENAIAGFTGMLRGFDAGLVHCHSVPAASLGVIAGNRMNIPCVFTSDGLTNILSGRGMGLQCAVICLNASSYGELTNTIPGADAYYVPHGSKTLPRAQAGEAGHAKPASLIFAGSLEWVKGADIAIPAMVELRRRLGVDCPTLNIYGDGHQREYLTELTTVLDLDDIVRFHGFKRDVLAQSLATDILVLPSRRESGPLVVLEAMSRGMPIVATAVGDVPSMLPDRRYGRVVPPNSLIALAEAIESLLADIAARQFDPDLLIERHDSRYSLEKWAERMDEAYQQVLLNNFTATS